MKKTCSGRRTFVSNKKKCKIKPKLSLTVNVKEYISFCVDFSLLSLVFISEVTLG